MIWIPPPKRVVAANSCPAIHWDVLCRRRTGEIRWKTRVQNTVVDVGLDDWLDKYLKGSAYTAAWYIGLTDGSPTVAGADTASSHAGWSEITNYDEAARQALTLGSVASQSVNNSAAVATFTINASVTIGGGFVISDNTKGGTTGTLLSVAAFAEGDKAADDDDTIEVTLTFTSADA